MLIYHSNDSFTVYPTLHILFAGSYPNTIRRVYEKLKLLFEN